MKALAAVLLFVFCVVAAIYCYREHIGHGDVMLSIAAFVSLYAVADALDSDSPSQGGA